MPISSSWHKIACENKNKNDWIVCNPFLISMIYFLNWRVSSNLKFMLNLIRVDAQGCLPIYLFNCRPCNHISQRNWLPTTFRPEYLIIQRMNPVN